jgi:5-methyltetrahydropteroyltriglutamate--homocysteine methyltransferase
MTKSLQMSNGPPAGTLTMVRADQVGSLLRPAALKEAHARYDEGRLDEGGLRAAEDEAIRDVIAMQEALGFPVLTDGEFRRLNFQDSFGASVVGLDAAQNTLRFHQQRVAGGTPLQRWEPGYTGAGPAITHRRPVVERLRLARNRPLEEYHFASCITSRPVKVTLIGPDRILQRFDHESSRHVYPDLAAFTRDVVAIERRMVQEVIDIGCRYVQIDEPSYTAYVDEPSLEEMRARGEDPIANLRRGIEADNAIIADFPARVTFGIHLCRGNQRSMWHREGTYDAIAEQLFGSLRHDRLLLEYDTERAGSFAPLRFVPHDKVVVLGLVTTKQPELEDADVLKHRIDQAAKFVPLERLAISPQCGFASDVEGNLLTVNDQWRKLELVQRVAEDVWR